MSDYPKVYAVSSKYKKILKNSSSGGVFYHIASYYINALHGVVYGAEFKDSIVEHVRISNINDLCRIQKSKYVKSNLGNTFKECGDDLQNGLYVVYSGTPCQIVALVSYLQYKKIKTDKLLTIDLICHGVPELKYWKAYLNEKFEGEKILDVDFRHKKPSWEDFSIKIVTNKRTYITKINNDEYMYLFLHNYTLQSSCFKCKFKGLNRKSDITLGDFWGVENYYPSAKNTRGTSLLFFNNAVQEKNLLKKLSSTINASLVSFGVATYSNPFYHICPAKPDKYDSFLCSTSILQNYHHLVENRPYNTLFLLLINVLKSLWKIPKPHINLKARNNSIGIITDTGYTNFGNRLQNYALRNTIEKAGFNTININFDNRKYKLFNFIREFLNFILHKKNKIREMKIKCASIKSGEINNYYTYKKLVKSFNTIIIGSDQIWNSSYHIKDLPFNLGFGIDKNTSISSYAASIGRSFIPNEAIPLYSEFLSKLQNVTVRENNAFSLLQNIGVKSKVVCDPTLLLSKEEWDATINQYSSCLLPKDKYTLTYLLKIDNRIKIDNEVDCLNPKSKYYVLNHFDFIKLIKYSDLIITDSYHAFIFSIIYRKKIKLYIRKEMFSRFDTLIKILGINYNEGSIIDFSSIDYEQLNVFINYSKEMLENIIQIKS